MKAADIFDLTGRAALVTGASSGLGARFAQVLAANGAAVALVARRTERIAALAEKIAQAGGRAVPITADVCDAAQMKSAFDQAEQALGAVTILVNNAGVVHTTRVLELTAEEWRRVLATDLDAVFSWAQEAARRMIAAEKAGTIVNISSVLGLNAGRGVAAYSAAKAGVIAVTKALALELAGRAVRVNALAPGWFVTDANRDYLGSPAGVAKIGDIPLRRFGVDGDLDGALLLLVSGAGSYMTGATLVVDGGQLIALRG